MIENVPPKQAWDMLISDPMAQLCDVRTDAEWNFVGVPDLSEIAKHVALIPWQVFPSMEVNANFVEQMKKVGFTPGHHIYFLCRSGGRSMAAAQAAKAAGFAHVYNVADGFEGPLDARGHRGLSAGWKADGLPWRQK